MSSANGFLDGAPLEFPCPECGRKVKTSVGDGRRNRSIRCPGGHTIIVDGSDLDRGATQVEKTLNDMMKRFK